VRAYRGEILLDVSDVRYNAANDEALAVRVRATDDAGLAAEHETLTHDLAAHFTYLANKTGWDARAVALAALADQFGARTADVAGDATITLALFYALFRAGPPANEAALYRADTATVEAAWKQSVAQGVIPAQLADDIPAALDQYRDLAAKQALDNPALGGGNAKPYTPYIPLCGQPYRRGHHTARRRDRATTTTAAPRRRRVQDNQGRTDPRPLSPSRPARAGLGGLHAGGLRAAHRVRAGDQEAGVNLRLTFRAFIRQI